MRVLCLSAYDAASHRRWRRQLAAHLSDHDWTVLSLPPRHFRWRIRGNSLYWAHQCRGALREDWDVVLATSMVDLNGLRGFVPALADPRTVVYFHENQFAYPPSRAQHDDISPAVVNLYSALSADQVAFNSHHNRMTFLDGVQRFVRQMPDFAPDHLVDTLAARSTVAPVPLSADWFCSRNQADRRPADHRPLSIVWNHRWEYDKAPERLFSALEKISKRGADFDLHVLGQRFRRCPPVFDRIRTTLSGHIETFGYVENTAAYRAILSSSDLAVSTALHEFQGLAMLEAIAAGCRPLAPHRLVYPEYVPERWLYRSFPDDAAREIDALASRLKRLCRQPADVRQSEPVDVSSFRWDALQGAYLDLLSA